MLQQKLNGNKKIIQNSQNQCGYENKCYVLKINRSPERLFFQKYGKKFDKELRRLNFELLVSLCFPNEKRFKTKPNN